jgi:bifunctional UDP-N-acetylglucosamine pyrophosphorylase/glucosamine-1-phosphate N-acetyltransferase
VEKSVVVISPDADEIRAKYGSDATGFAVQESARGTGHAVMAADAHYIDDDEVMILCGDMPLVSAHFLGEFAAFFRESGCVAAVAAVQKQDMGDFGRVYDDGGKLQAIVEARDITPQHASTNWGNTGIYMFRGASLRRALAQITTDNSQGEYYLTDAPMILAKAGEDVRVFHSQENENAFIGINTQMQLSQAAWHMQCAINLHHLNAGVCINSPDTTFIDSTAIIAPGAIIRSGCIIEGSCEIAAGAVIGPNSHLTDTIVRENATVRHSVTEGAVIGAGTAVGPFAYLRPGADIGEKCRIGNFVEVKNATLADGVKMAHLSYIGDADVGAGVNYSCGAITANYDGTNKHRTTIGAGAFIGSNVNLVAPVNIGEGAFAAAGSTITQDLPPCALGIARSRQTCKENWRK